MKAVIEKKAKDLYVIKIYGSDGFFESYAVVDIAYVNLTAGGK